MANVYANIHWYYFGIFNVLPLRFLCEVIFIAKNEFLPFAKIV